MTELFNAAMVPSRTTGQNALRELFSAGKIQRTGAGCKKDVFRFFSSKKEERKEDGR
jgi:hypothetical protein